MPGGRIHTFGMSFSIDVLFLGEAGEVLAYCTMPSERSANYPGSNSVLELPAGMIAASGTERGDRLEFEEY